MKFVDRCGETQLQVGEKVLINHFIKMEQLLIILEMII